VNAGLQEVRETWWVQCKWQYISRDRKNILQTDVYNYCSVRLWLQTAIWTWKGIGSGIFVSHKMTCSHLGNTVAIGMHELLSATNVTLSIQELQNTHMDWWYAHSSDSFQCCCPEFGIWILCLACRIISGAIIGKVLRRMLSNSWSFIHFYCTC